MLTDPAARAERARRYDELFNYARTVAQQIVQGPERPRSSRALRIHQAALALLAAPDRAVIGPGVARTAAHDSLDALADEWPAIAEGRSDGAALIRHRPRLWPRLMTEWPMREYADLLVETLSGLPGQVGRILEVGSGVGNTTARLAEIYGDRLTWSDGEPSFVRHGKWRGSKCVFDFDYDPPAQLAKFDAVAGTNAVHCAANIGRTLRRLRDLLTPSGLLLIAEGSSPTRADGTPWALDIFFSAFDGWWDRSGFRTRGEWLSELAAQEFTDLAFTPLEAGDDDLGGVIWCRRRG